MIWKLLFISFGFASAKTTEYATPQELDELWASGQDQTFAKILGIPDGTPVRPDESAEAYAGSHNESFLCDFKLPEAEKGINFLNLERKRWTGGKIPYFISQKSYGATQRQFIIDAINALNKKTTKLKLVPYRGHKDYVFVYNGPLCVVYMLGRKGGPQALSLNKNSCLSKPGSVQHEFMHIAGLEHEHNRSDRDKYIEVLMDNIPEEIRGQFNKSDSYRIGPYDYYSVMHYQYELQEGKPAFKVLKPNVDKSRIGQKEGPTDTDIQKIEKLYS